ncbi:MAG TPA: putative lipid II flippase FtsW [Candidatus Omnitrophota bacterium]|nr:putative lipid II flippase FtsW [Candidatus Omnitrophota bacterium]
MKKRPDVIFLLLAATLIMIGTIMIFSASPALALKHGDTFYYLKRHLFYILLGLFGFNFALKLNLANLKKYSSLILLVSLALLVMVFLPHVGRSMGGASRWIDLYVISFQPSELAKFAVILFLASALANKKEGIRDFMTGLLPLLLIVGLVAAIIIKQPDLGTALSICFTSFLMLFVAGAQLIHLGVLLAAGAAGVLAISILSPYRMKRLFAYLNPWNDPLNIGFQIIQSLLAVGSGGIFGLGLGNSRQKFYYLPQQYADFIFAVLCEELGFIGAVVVLVLFVIFFARGIGIALKASDSFSYYLGMGIIIMFAVQTFMNLSVVLGLIPTTGIPLPFVSYGGTATLINLFSVGLVANISRNAK